MIRSRTASSEGLAPCGPGYWKTFRCAASRSTSSLRLCGQVLALGVALHPVLVWSWFAWQLQPPERNNLLRKLQLITIDATAECAAGSRQPLVRPGSWP
jgi:sulfite exporter TauE/SafE